MTSTAHYDKEIDDFLERHFFYIRLSHKTELPIINKYATPKTLGKDRLAGVVAASALYAKKNVLVIDAGTCITFDFINNDREYLGGSIHPGITMRFKALNNFTDKLPLIKRSSDFELIGNSTEKAILTGVLYAVLKEIQGMIEDYMGKYNDLTIIFTGGDASFFVSRLKNKIFAHPNLVLEGLNEILRYNAAQID